MQIAAANPKYIKKEDISQEVLKLQPDLKTFIKEVCLIEQPFIKDPQKTINDCLHTLIASVGENIFISRFVRFKVNEA